MILKSKQGNEVERIRKLERVERNEMRKDERDIKTGEKINN